MTSPATGGQLVDLATRLIVEEALEAETRDAVGREIMNMVSNPARVAGMATALAV